MKLPSLSEVFIIEEASQEDDEQQDAKIVPLDIQKELIEAFKKSGFPNIYNSWEKQSFKMPKEAQDELRADIKKYGVQSITRLIGFAYRWKHMDPEFSMQQSLHPEQGMCSDFFGKPGARLYRGFAVEEDSAYAENPVGSTFVWKKRKMTPVSFFETKNAAMGYASAALDIQQDAPIAVIVQTISMGNAYYAVVPPEDGPDWYKPIYVSFLKSQGKDESDEENVSGENVVITKDIKWKLIEKSTSEDIDTNDQDTETLQQQYAARQAANAPKKPKAQQATQKKASFKKPAEGEEIEINPEKMPATFSKEMGDWLKSKEEEDK